MADIDSGGNKNFTFRFMKTNCWLILGMMLATSCRRAGQHQHAAGDSPAGHRRARRAGARGARRRRPAPTRPASKAVKAKKKGVKTKARREGRGHESADVARRPVTLVPGPATVAADNVNVRGQAGLEGRSRRPPEEGRHGDGPVAKSLWTSPRRANPRNGRKSPCPPAPRSG